MAKKEKDFEEAAMQGVDSGASEEAQVNDSREATEVKVTGSKKVKITIMDKVDCIIAGKHYELDKGKTYQVPSDVAAILCYAEKAYRI